MTDRDGAPGDRGAVTVFLRAGPVSRPWPFLSACPGWQPKGSTRTGFRHCERSVAIQCGRRWRPGPDALDCRVAALLAMTGAGGGFSLFPFAGVQPCRATCSIAGHASKNSPIQQAFLQISGSDMDSAWPGKRKRPR